MPLIIDRDEKVKDLCILAFNRFIDSGIDKFSLNRFIDETKISKGQFYHYFKTKEDLIFEVMSFKTEENIEKIEENLKSQEGYFEKLVTLFSFYLSSYEEAVNYRKLIFDTLDIYIHSNQPRIEEFNTRINNWLDSKVLEIFKDIKLNSSELEIVKAITSTADGIYVRSLLMSSFDLEKELTTYLKSVVNLISRRENES